MKSFTVKVIINDLKSPPSRGAWIEIIALIDKYENFDVAPLAGGVD